MALAALVQSPTGPTLAQAQRVLWPKYESHKVVAAAVISEIVRGPDDRITLMVKPEPDSAIEPFWPTVPAMADRAEIGGYAVIYEDGFCSVSPGALFTNGYRRIDPTPEPPQSPPPKLPTPAGD
jgi:hypothetical protein